jgi:hypothetical protein
VAYPTASALLSNPLLLGIRDLLFYRDIGLLVFAPWLLVVFACLLSFIRRHSAEAALSIERFLINLLFFAKYESWRGGWVVGPRFLLPAIPFLALALASWIEKVRYSATDTSIRAPLPAFRPVLIGLVLCGFLLEAVILPYPAERYGVLWRFYRDQPRKPWWEDSIFLASLEFCFERSSKPLQPRSLESGLSSQESELRAEQVLFASLKAGVSEDEALRSLPIPRICCCPIYCS